MLRLEMVEMKEMITLVPMENILWVSKNKESGECSVYVREWGEILVTESTLNEYLKLKDIELLKNKNVPIYHSGSSFLLKGRVKMKHIMAVKINQSVNTCIIYTEPGILESDTHRTSMNYVNDINKYLRYKDSENTFLEDFEDIPNNQIEL